MKSYQDAIEIAPNIYWVGMCLENDPFQCHPYFIKNGNESILIDPGSMIEFDETIRKVKSISDLNSIKYIVLHHQDPDLAAAVPSIEKLIDRDDLLIVTHSRMSLLVKHYLIQSSYYEIDRENYLLNTSTGLSLEFHTTPYCHSPGAFVSYEPKSKTLFSGDIFGGIDESWEFYADETYFEKAKQFHEEYMPSKDIFNYALNKIDSLEISLIAPQHGSVIQKPYIKKLIQDMKELDCGLYIEKKYNLELLDTINELKLKDSLIFEQSKRAEIGEMIGNIAHQWRQPLAVLNTIVAIMNEKNSQNLLTQEETADKLISIENKINYMADTMEDFMNYYRPDKNRVLFSASQAIENSLDIVSFNLSIVNITIKDDKGIEIYGLKNEFIQVLVSIFSNVQDIIKIKKLSSASIEIELLKKDKSTIISIKDNLGGINKEHISKIFDPYFTTKHQKQGTGLGLHIAKMLIEENMNGSLSAVNITDGAKFIIEVSDND